MKHFYLILILFLITGCTDKNAVNVTDATGVVTLDGKPLEGATISFVPTTDGLRDSASLSDADGKFVLMTTGATKNGAMPGEYDVFVEKRIQVDGAGNPIKEVPVVPMGSEPDSSAPSVMPKYKSLVPEKYHNYSKPLFHIKVEKGGKNHFVLELDSV